MIASRMLPSLKKSTLMLTQRALQIYGDLGTARLLPMISTMHLLKPKSICTTSLDRASTIEVIQPIRPIERMLKKIGILDVQKYRYMALGSLVYEHVMAQVDYPFFYKHFNMADTFFSWFLVTELHLWMIMVRYMAEGNAGRLVRNSAVNSLWEDTKARAMNLGKIREKLRNKQIQELSQQFNAAIIGYDEGIQSNDKVLAAALWRRFFHLECNNPEHVETLIIYVRKQISLFDNLPSHEILRKPVLKLIDIKDICKPQN
ncbi:ubiquinol-cytochrome-c reductase complex assembly factor 1 isoform X3 [Camponotus floridanus]|uniref:ubiquinol-cytochrome-c reductase complex assembly factor 1 isoform X3 n=1 Tax=Camponotus floridanus TaxID=104421 RepID=UPI00059CBE9D|nr:ubiquinol-cytochrome-c reductase complex assembly factor 1 isoform X3 [Camponotus floridanus]